jgi:Rad3-related DNA helicase
VRALVQHYGPGAVGEMAEAVEAGQESASRIRLEAGVWPEDLVPLWRQVQQAAARWHALAAELSAWMRELRAEDDSLAEVTTLHVAEIGPPHRRLAELLDLANLMLESGDPAPAKWLDFDVQGGLLRVQAKASPISSAGVLRSQLWGRLRAAVVCSATLQALGRFDYFLRESGLQGEEGVRALAVGSPFDHAAQGRFIVAETRASPKLPAEHTAEGGAPAGRGPCARSSTARWCCARAGCSCRGSVRPCPPASSASCACRAARRARPCCARTARRCRPANARC